MEYTRQSYWHKTTNPKNYPYNQENKTYDILIIGAGITGLTTAYLLRNSGYKIGIIEATKIGYGTTGYTTAKVTVQHELQYDYLLKNFSPREAKQYLKANTEGLNIIKEIIKSNNINCDLDEQTAYVYTTHEDEMEMLEQEFEAYKKLGIDGFYTNDANLPFKTVAALGIKNQSQFHPLKYIYGLCRVLNDSCCDIFENVRAESIQPHSKAHIVKTNCGDIHANKVIVTSHYPFDNDFGMFFLRMYQEKSYIIAAKTEEKLFDGMYINVNNPIYSLKYHQIGDDNILFLGGANHKVAITDSEEDSYKNLENFLKTHFSKYEIIDKWSSQDCMTYDKIPYIGRIADNVDNIYVATGFNKWGMTTSAAAALILRNAILNISDDFSEIFDPQRITPMLSAKDFLSTGMHTASGLIKRLYAGSFEELSSIETGCGKIINYNGKKVGAYKNENGDYFCIKPVCTHLGCALSFNDAEKTWDCQCHGSRFDIKGNILEGPTVRPLDRVNVRKVDKA